jgi:hypothetical protein
MTEEFARCGGGSPFLETTVRFVVMVQTPMKGRFFTSLRCVLNAGEMELFANWNAQSQPLITQKEAVKRSGTDD